MIVSFSGLDGAGKSTHIERTVRYLNGVGIDTKVIEIYNISVFTILGRLLNFFSAKRAQTLVGEQFKSAGAPSRKKRALAFIRRLSLYLDLFIFNFAVRGLATRGGRWVICDRFFYDAAAQLFFLDMCTRRFYEKALLKIADPDIPILLLVDPAIAFGRKPEYDFRYFSIKNKLYREMALRKDHLQIIESQGIDVTQKKIERVILKKRMNKSGDV